MIEKAVPSSPLAIVIPAYKGRFLRAALASIAAQTDQRFHLYVCDDGSPEDLEAICAAAPYPSDRLTYRRFDPNTGARDLVRHWNRGVQCADEPWVWLFSDDDIMEPTCVETFLRVMEADGREGADVYRFNTLIIDAAGEVLRINPPHPSHESTIEFAYHRLMFQRQSYAPEYLFRRSVWERRGGFVEFPFGQGSDDASWITFAQERGITLLSGPRVHWRYSGVNVSAGGKADYVERAKSSIEFAAWLKHHFEARSPLPPNVPAAFAMVELIQNWLLSALRTCPMVFSPHDLRRLPGLVEAKLGVPRRHVLQALLGASRRALGHTISAPIRRLIFGFPQG